MTMTCVCGAASHRIRGHVGERCATTRVVEQPDADFRGYDASLSRLAILETHRHATR